MRYFLCTLILLLSVTSIIKVNAQVVSDSTVLAKNIFDADSIVIVSHEGTGDFAVIMDEKTGKKRFLPEVVVNGKVNNKIIIKRKLLPDSLKYHLANLFTSPNHDRTITGGNNFAAFHAILLFKKSKVIYIDICFVCNRFLFVNSKKEIGPNYLDKEKIISLMQLFTSNGINPEID